MSQLIIPATIYYLLCLLFIFSRVSIICHKMTYIVAVISNCDKQMYKSFISLHLNCNVAVTSNCDISGGSPFFIFSMYHEFILLCWIIFLSNDNFKYVKTFISNIYNQKYTFISSQLLITATVKNQVTTIY